MFAAILKNARTVHGPQTAGSLTEKEGAQISIRTLLTAIYNIIISCQATCG